MTKLGLSLLIITGMAFLVLGIFKALKVVSLIKHKKNWWILIILMSFFLVGYCLFLVGFNLDMKIHLDILVGLIFFFGSIFVFITMIVSSRTVEDVLRVNKLELMAITDPLTGLYNRRYIESRAESEIKRAARYGHALSLLMVDIDHFKAVNDAFGHQAGDEVLRQISRTLKSSSRESDLVARFGGEEFLLLYPETAIGPAKTAAERLRKRIRDLEIKLPAEALSQAGDARNRTPIKITISIGISGSSSENGGNYSDLLEKADKALYRAKMEGRDRVVIDGETDSPVR